MPGRVPGLPARVWFTPRQFSLSLASPCTVAEQVSYSSSLYYVNQVVWLGCDPQLRITCLSQHSLGSQRGQLGAAAFGERLSSESSASLRMQSCSPAMLGITSGQQKKLLWKDHTIIRVGKAPFKIIQPSSSAAKAASKLWPQVPLPQVLQTLPVMVTAPLP